MTPDATYLQDSSNRLPCPRHAYPAYVNLASVGSRDSPVIRPAALGPWPLSQRPARDDPDDMSISASNRLLSALAVVATVAAGLTFWLPDILTGPAVMNGSARGTALVVLVIGVPALVVSMRPAARGSVRALAIGMGAVTYLCYNAVMFAFATPFNRLFLLYVAMLGLSVWALVGLVLHTDPSTIRTDRLPARPVAIYIWVVVALNALVWLRTIVPALFAERPTEILDGTGVATNAVFVQDLAIWLPGMAVIAVLLWRRRRWGVLLAGAGLVFWFIEAVGVAVDQWFGSRADPSSDVASMSVVPAFVVLATIGLGVAGLHLRALRVSVPDLQR